MGTSLKKRLLSGGDPKIMASAKWAGTPKSDQLEESSKGIMRLSELMGIGYRDKHLGQDSEFSAYISDLCSSIFIYDNKLNPSLMFKDSVLLLRVVPTLKELFLGIQKEEGLSWFKYDNGEIKHQFPEIKIVYTFYSGDKFPDQLVLSIELGSRGSIVMGFSEPSKFKSKSNDQKYSDAADEEGDIPVYDNVWLYYSPENTDIASKISAALDNNSRGKLSGREKPTIEMIAFSRDLYTRKIELTFDHDPEEDLDIHYGEGFGEFDRLLNQRIEDESKGIVMLYGSPGTGKTHYIRRLISKISRKGNKRIVLIPKYILEQIEGPQFNTFMTSHFMDSEALFIIEDAESIISERSQSGDGRSSLVSTLLNISDGILNDIFKIQVIVTFNTSMSNIDKALTRPGRLIAQRNFPPLNKEYAQSLIEHLGIEHEADGNMTLAEIYALKDEEYEEVLMGNMVRGKVEKIGFQ